MSESKPIGTDNNTQGGTRSAKREYRHGLTLVGLGFGLTAAALLFQCVMYYAAGAFDPLIGYVVVGLGITALVGAVLTLSGSVMLYRGGVGKVLPGVLVLCSSLELLAPMYTFTRKNSDLIELQGPAYMLAGPNRKSATTPGATGNAYSDVKDNVQWAFMTSQANYPATATAMLVTGEVTVGYGYMARTIDLAEQVSFALFAASVFEILTISLVGIILLNALRRAGVRHGRLTVWVCLGLFWGAVTVVTLLALSPVDLKEASKADSQALARVIMTVFWVLVMAAYSGLAVTALRSRRSV